MNSLKLMVSAVAMSCALVAACSSTPQSSSSFSSSQAGRAQSVQWGTIEGIRAVTITNDNRRVGTATGAVLGGIAGSTIGSGTRANTAGAVAGAVAGGAVGNSVTATTTNAVEFTVRLESGASLAVVQPGSVNEYRVGDRVRVTSDGTTTRVTR
ncbi:MAG TPA: glycine zipper 2TM domain-containing protein [Lysobacter sp.]